jgi:16S rRNA (cytosine967-C5)-methyltransferase
MTDGNVRSLSLPPARASTRELAAWAIERTLEERRPLATDLATAEALCRPRDRGLLRQLVLGTVRWLLRLDEIVRQASSRPLSRIDPLILAPLRLGVYQLVFLDGVPAHAAVDESVAMARNRTHKGAAGFVNAVLRQVSRKPRLEDWPVRGGNSVSRLAIEQSHPLFLVQRWLRRIGEQATRSLLEANNRPRGLHLLTFSDRGGPAVAAERLLESGCRTEPSLVAPLGLRVLEGRPFETASFSDGEIYVQDEGSQLAALLPPPIAGEQVLDVAAAPGGKTFSLMACEPGVRATVSDFSLSRLRVLDENLSRLGRRAGELVMDGARPALRPVFDRVVVDLPCSGTGTLRKYPELKWRLSEAEIGRLGRQGRVLVDASAGLVKPGGLLVVITCSLEHDENEIVMRGVLESADFAAVDLVEHLASDAAGRVEGPGLWRLWTGADHDGFTVQVARKAESA